MAQRSLMNYVGLHRPPAGCRLNRHREPGATTPGDSSRGRDADRADYHACGRSGSPDAEAEASTRT